MRHIRRKSLSSRIVNRILIMLAFFSISAGLWANFRQLWLQDNGYSASEISALTSLATFLSVGGIILVGWKLKPTSLKTFMTLILVVRLLNSGVLFMLNNTGQTVPINICTVIEIFTGYIIVASVYPLLTTVLKSNKAYSKRKLVEYLFRDVGVLVGGILIGQGMTGLDLDYNACLAVSMVFLACAIGVMFSIKIPTATSSAKALKLAHSATSSKPVHSITSSIKAPKITKSAPLSTKASKSAKIISSTHSAKNTKSTIKYILNNKIQTYYMLYAFLSSTSFATALGLKMLILTGQLDLSASTATSYLLVCGFAGDILGIIALRFFTPKNDYVTMTLKFGIRFSIYAIAVLVNNPFVFLLAFTWALLSETAYEDVSDGYYINLIDNRHQLGYNTIKHVMNYLGEATGVLFCGLMYDFGLTAIFGLSAFIMIFQISIAYYLISLRHRRRRTRHSASRLRYD